MELVLWITTTHVSLALVAKKMRFTMRILRNKFREIKDSEPRRQNKIS